MDSVHLAPNFAGIGNRHICGVRPADPDAVQAGKEVSGIGDAVVVGRAAGDRYAVALAEDDSPIDDAGCAVDQHGSICTVGAIGRDYPTDLVYEVPLELGSNQTPDRSDAEAVDATVP